VVFNPWLSVVNDGSLPGSGVNNFPIVYTDATYTGTSTYIQAISGSAFSTVGVNGQNSNSIYTTSDFTTNLWEYRLVAAGLRASYIGDNFHNSGKYILARDEDNDSIPSGTAFATLMNDNYTAMHTLDRQTHYITTPLTNYSLYGYFPITNYQGNTPNGGRYCLGIFVDGCDKTTPQSYEFEAVAFFEINGRNLTTVPSESDPSGLAAVNGAIAQLVRAPTAPPQVVERTLLQTATEYLSSFSNMIPQPLFKAGKAIGSAMIDSYLPGLGSAISAMEL